MSSMPQHQIIPIPMPMPMYHPQPMQQMAPAPAPAGPVTGTNWHTTAAFDAKIDAECRKEHQELMAAHKNLEDVMKKQAAMHTQLMKSHADLMKNGFGGGAA